MSITKSNRTSGGTCTRAMVAGGIAVIGTAAIAGMCVESPSMLLLAQGDPAPSTTDAYETFDRPNISASGHVAFAGDLDGATAADDVVYVDDRLVARQGDVAPGADPATYLTFEFFESANQVNASGDVAYIATLSGAGLGANRALYREDVLIAQSASPIAAIPGRVAEEFGFASLTDAGDVGYLLTLEGKTDDDSVVMLGDAVVYRERDEAPPGLGAGIIFDNNFDELQFNRNGDLVVEANTSLPLSMDQVLLRRLADGTVDYPLREGQDIDARDGLDFLELFLQFVIADNGQWGMRGNLGIAPSTDDAFIMTDSGFYAQQGDVVDELPGVVLGNFNSVDVNSGGDVLYLADLEGAVPAGVDEALFLNGCLVISDGVQAPGLPDGVLLTDIGFEDAYINDDRMIVFAASYDGGDGLFTIDAGDMSDCPADFNMDGEVGFVDLTTLLAAYGACPAVGPCIADLDGDGDVGFVDLTMLLAAYGECEG